MKLSKEELEEKILSGFTGGVDFFTDWCSPCKAMSPVIDSINAMYESERIYKINLEEEKDLGKKFEVRSIPTIIIFKNGEETNRFIGITQKNKIIEALNS